MCYYAASIWYPGGWIFVLITRRIYLGITIAVMHTLKIYASSVIFRVFPLSITRTHTGPLHRSVHLRYVRSNPRNFDSHTDWSPSHRRHEHAVVSMEAIAKTNIPTHALDRGHCPHGALLAATCLFLDTMAIHIGTGSELDFWHICRAIHKFRAKPSLVHGVIRAPICPM